MSITRHFVLAAGGTGGHMMPAHALAAELIARGHQVALITDERGAKIPGLFDGVQTHILPAGRITKNPMSWPGGARAIPQSLFTPVELAKQMQKLGLEPVGLTNAAKAARGCGRPHATRDLANLLESLGRPPVVDGLKAENWGGGALAGAGA